MAAKARAWTVSLPRRAPDLAAALRKAIRANAKQYLSPAFKGASHLGIVKLAESLPRWLDMAKRPADDLALAALLMEKAGTGGSLFRNFYRDFLAEARDHLAGARKNLAEAQALFAESAQEWGRCCGALDSSARTGEAAPLVEAAGRCRRIAEIEVAAMRQLVNTLMESKTYRFLASSPRGFGDSVSCRIEELRRRRRARTRARRRIHGAARSGVPRLSRIARGAAACSSRWRRSMRLATKPFTTRRAPSTGASTSIRHAPSPATFSGKHPEITHTKFGALRLKDAICDKLRDTTGSRPDVATDRPAVRIHAHARWSAGHDLHRSRRAKACTGADIARRRVKAPLRENLAAGILLRAGWLEKCKKAAEFLDPMCGSGTLVIEAAMIAANAAPGARRQYFGFQGWKGQRPLCLGQGEAGCAGARAEAHAEIARPRLRQLGARRRARECRARRIGRASTFERGQLVDAKASEPGETVGFLATNPPYGVRLEDRDTARALMKQLGEVLRENFSGWDAVILAGSPDAGLELGIRAERVHTV